MIRDEVAKGIRLAESTPDDKAVISACDERPDAIGIRFSQCLDLRSGGIEEISAKGGVWMVAVRIGQRPERLPPDIERDIGYRGNRWRTDGVMPSSMWRKAAA